MLVVGGPNGSGKTTLALEYAAETGFPSLGADDIAASLNPGNLASVQFAAGRQFAIHALSTFMKLMETDND